MKEVKFRWIDQYLIHMTLKTKFTILAVVPMLMIIGLTLFLNNLHADNLQKTNNNNHLQFIKQANNYFESTYNLIDESKRDELKTQLSDTSQMVNIDNLDNRLLVLAQQGGGISEQDNITRIVSGINSHDMVIVSELSSKKLAQNSTLWSSK